MRAPDPAEGERRFGRGIERLWGTENGPECNDEINIVESGQDLGWGAEGTLHGSARSGKHQSGRTGPGDAFGLLYANGRAGRDRILRRMLAWCG
jgi:hypothetical protein